MTGYMVVIATVFGMVGLGLLGLILDRWWRRWLNPPRRR